MAHGCVVNVRAVQNARLLAGPDDNDIFAAKAGLVVLSDVLLIV